MTTIKTIKTTDHFRAAKEIRRLAKGRIVLVPVQTPWTAEEVTMTTHVDDVIREMLGRLYHSQQQEEIALTATITQPFEGSSEYVTYRLERIIHHYQHDDRPEGYINTYEAAELLGMSADKVRRHQSVGNLTCVGYTNMPTSAGRMGPTIRLYQRSEVMGLRDMLMETQPNYVPPPHRKIIRQELEGAVA